MYTPKIYLGTVALEINRWSTRIPTFQVSGWLPQIKAAGFQGLELWENHVLKSPGEAEKIKSSNFPVAIYNHYGLFSGTPEENEKLETAVKTITQLNAKAVKYNIGNDPALLQHYKENVQRFANALPKDCILLCECHAGTLLETDEAAEAFFKDLCPQKFALIVHPFGPPEELHAKFERFSQRITQIHSQLSNQEGNRICLEEWPERVDACLNIIKKNNFTGNFTIEFTGLTAAPGENIDALFANTIKDMTYIREFFS
ncbi:MAG: hypothetical protein FWE42_09880 [Defluviitaleaceae bacterium]|nr:hypothetical protein [Defluviitaleaceae bacterium]